jgi:hypothetical protein
VKKKKRNDKGDKWHYKRNLKIKLKSKNQYFFLVEEKNECLLCSISTPNAPLQYLLSLLMCPSGFWIDQV